MPNPVRGPTVSSKDDFDNLPNRPATRSVTKAKLEILKDNTYNCNKSEYLIDFENQNMAQGHLSLETLIKLIPNFEGNQGGEIHRFLNACDFAMQNIDPSLQPVLVQAIKTKLGGKAFAITQNRIITDWSGLKTLLENAFCAQRTPGYLQLELISLKQKSGEAVQEYANKLENLLHELCNVSVVGKTVEAATAIREYIKETTLTTFIEGLEPNLRQIIKSRHHPSLEEAINDSLEEEKLIKSNADTQRLFQNRQEKNWPSKYCTVCHKRNHNTNQCRFAKPNSGPKDTGQSSLQQQTNNTYVHKISCSYCKAKGHIREDCFKKKRADNRQSDKFQPSTSGNGSRSNVQGSRSVKDIKAMGPIKNLCIESQD